MYKTKSLKRDYKKKKMHLIQFPFHTVALEMTVPSKSYLLCVMSPSISLFFT